MKNQVIWLVQTYCAKATLEIQWSSRLHLLYFSNSVTTSNEKSAQTVQSFLRYSNLKIRLIWLDNAFLGHDMRTKHPVFAKTWPVSNSNYMRKFRKIIQAVFEKYCNVFCTVSVPNLGPFSQKSQEGLILNFIITWHTPVWSVY